jgi:hypothetical protein
MKTIVHNYHELFSSLTTTEALQVVSEVLEKRDLFNASGDTRLSRGYHSAKRTQNYALGRMRVGNYRGLHEIYAAASDTLFNQKQIVDLIWILTQFYACH